MERQDSFHTRWLGYFCRDPDSTPERPVFNRTVALRDTWARLKAKAGGSDKARGR